MKATTKTTSPDTQSGPEWIRVAEACQFARVSKPVIYEWMNRGWIKNFSGRQRGQVKGTRLISFDSLRHFIESRATGGEKLP